MKTTNIKYDVRNEIFEDGRVQCPAFSVPPIAYDPDRELEDIDISKIKRDGLEEYAEIRKARRLWHKLYMVIMDH